MPARSYNTNPASNTALNGIGIAAGLMARSDVDNAFRQVAADLKGLVREINAKTEYGAIGDGVTDDTVALNAALAAAQAGNLGLYIPEGAYRTTGLALTITGGDLAAKLNVRGAGRRATVIKSLSGTSPVLSFTGSAIPTECNLDLSDMTIDGNGKAADGVKLTGVAHATLERLIVEFCDKAVHGLGSLILKIDDCTLQRSNIGAYFRKSGAIYANAITIRDCRMNYNTIWAVDYGEGSGLKIRDGQIEVNGTDAATVTITNASPGVVTWTAHGLPNGTEVKFTTTGALPAPLVAGTSYYVVSTATNTFQVAATVGGAAIDTTTAGSGVHTGSAVGTGGVIIRATIDDETGYGKVTIDGVHIEGTKGRAISVESAPGLSLTIAETSILATENGRCITVAGAAHVKLSGVLLPSGGDTADINCNYLTKEDSLIANLTGVRDATVEINETNAGTPVIGISVTGGSVRVVPVTVATLPAAGGRSGARHTVSDATATLTAGIGAVVAGGGANVVPVFSDGVNWRIG